MGIEFSTSLELRDRRAELERPSSLDDIADIVANWLQIRDDLTMPGRYAVDSRPEGAATVESLSTPDESLKAWIFTLAHRDAEDRALEWRVRVSAIFGELTKVLIEVERANLDRRIRRDTGAPAVPGLLAKLLNDPATQATDGAHGIATTALVVDASQVPSFVESRIRDRDRRLPIVAVTQAPQTDGAFDPDRLARRLAGFAHVAFFPDDAATWALTDVDPDLAVYRGAVRIWFPREPFEQAPRLIPKPGRSFERWIERQVFAAYRMAHQVPAELLTIRRAISAERDRALEQQLAELRGRLATQRTHNADVGELERQLTEVGGLVAQLKSDRDDAEAYGDEALAEARQATEQRDALAEENRRLRSKLFALNATLGKGSDEDLAHDNDPVAAFEQRIRDAYLTLFTEDDRERSPMLDFSVCPELPESIERTGVDPDKVARICAELAARRPAASREVHKLRTHGAGGAPARTRSFDDALAWRCYPEQKTPQAKRLHWWQTPDGRLEFACVALHDDTDIPE